MTHEHLEALFPANSRSREIGEIVQHIVLGDSCQMIGMPGVGREDVFGLLTYNYNVRVKHLGEEQAKYHFVMVNFAEVNGKPYMDAVKLLFFSLANSLSEREYVEQAENVVGLLQKSMAFNDEVALVQGLKEAVHFLTQEKGLTIVFLLHRFEQYATQVDSAFFVLIDSLHTVAPNQFAVVFSLTRPLEQLLEEKAYKEMMPNLSGMHVYLSVHDEPSILFRIDHTAAKLKKIAPLGLKDDLLSLTGGHRKMTKRAIEEVLQNDELLQVFSTSIGHDIVADKERLREYLLESTLVRSVSYEIWNNLLPSEQLLLKRQLQKRGEHIAESEDEKKTGIFLQNLQVLLNNYFTIPLFEEFVRYRLEHGLDEKLSLQHETGEILMGEQSITTKFTSLEYKLLRLFLTNPGAIVEREQLIAAVWGDAKTTAGVTDQAIDQLIFRLRKKIEENPNEPTHLLTVKGRGFQFVVS
ncbi:MAG: hypothetical protein RLZZ455_1212 [Candidatus Parcubacteria bacterium]|jgi:hypothetical protein